MNLADIKRIVSNRFSDLEREFDIWRYERIVNNMSKPREERQIAFAAMSALIRSRRPRQPEFRKWRVWR